MATLWIFASSLSPKNGHIHLSRAYRRLSIVVCSRGLRLRLARDLSQISACCLKVMFEVDSMKVCAELVPNCSSFSAAARSAMVRVLQILKDAIACHGSAFPGTSSQYRTYAGSCGSQSSDFF